MKEIEETMRCLCEKEMAFLQRMEREHRDQLNALQREMHMLKR